jgi:hypothetical protein
MLKGKSFSTETWNSCIWYCHAYGVTIHGVWIRNWTTNNYSANANSHALQFIAIRTKSSQSAVFLPVVAWQRLPTPHLPCSCSYWPATVSQLTPTPLAAVSRLFVIALYPHYIASVRTAQKTSPKIFHSCVTYVSHGPRREHRFPVTPLLRVNKSVSAITKQHVYVPHYLEDFVPSSYRTQRLQYVRATDYDI